VNSKIVSFFMWHILFSLRIAARQHRHDMPPNHPITNFRALLKFRGDFTLVDINPPKNGSKIARGVC